MKFISSIKGLTAASIIALSSCQMQPALAEENAEVALGQIKAEAMIFMLFTQKDSQSARIAHGIKILKSNLKDPYSAKTRKVFLKKFSDGVIVCGEVNAKNGFGAYTGFSKFAAGNTQVFFEADTPVVSLVCSK